MKNFCKKLLCIALVLCAAFAPAGCGKGDKSLNSATDVQIYFWQSGYGANWIKRIVRDFNEVQDEYHVTVDVEPIAQTIINSLDLGKSNTYDLYFTMLNTTMYNKSFADLSDVLSSDAYGENVTIESKYFPYLLDGMRKSDGTFDSLTYGNGWIGIVYNTDMIAQSDLPRTTDELDLLTKDLTNSLTGKKKPWIFYNDQYNNGYWNYLLTAWEAQYDGLDYYRDTTMALSDGVSAPSKEVLTRKDGRYKALEVLESLITPNTVHEQVTNTIFTRVQTLFLDGEAAMTVNGSWLPNESKGKAPIAMMKLPVISSIVETLEDKSMSDETLAEIVGEVDGGAQTSALCSAADFARIRQARNYMYNNSCEQYVFIPDYSPAKAGAKEFLKYFYSDAGSVEFMKDNQLPSSVRLTDESKFDTSTLSDWGKAMFGYTYNASAVTDYKNKSDVYIDASINQFANLTYAQALCAKNSRDRKNASDLWKLLEAKVNENWSDWVH